MMHPENPAQWMRENGLKFQKGIAPGNKSGKERQGMYLHEVEITKNLSDVFKTANGSTPLRSKLIMAQHADKVNSCSKVVDENGEPLVVHHASKKQFEEFITKNTSRAG